MYKTIINYDGNIYEYTNRTARAAFRQHYPGFNYRESEYYGQFHGDFKIVNTKTGEVVFHDSF